MTEQEQLLITLGMVAIETLKEVLDILGVDRAELSTGTQIIEAFKARLKEVTGND